MIVLPKFVPKGWGWESWLANTDEYCGKILYVHRSKMCSYHYHKVKDETFYLQDGRIQLLYSQPENGGMENPFMDEVGQAMQLTLEPGDCFHVPRLMRHRFIGLKDSHIIEISTHHEDSDSYRIEKGD